MPIHIGIAYFATGANRAVYAALPTLARPTALEWTIDQYAFHAVGSEDEECLRRYAAQGTLIGHGVHFSIFAAPGNDINECWLRGLRQDPYLSFYERVSVHFGFSTGWKIKRGAPFPAPLHPAALSAGLHNLEKLARTASCRVGLENLALAFSMRDVEDQGRFLDKLLTPCDGYLLLDIHNLYCQMKNFGIPLMTLAAYYPLNRVEEIHVSGGSWCEHIAQGSRRKLRRDTHNDAVPEELFSFLAELLPCCPNLKYVVLEQMPEALTSPEQQRQFIADYATLKTLVVNHA